MNIRLYSVYIDAAGRILRVHCIVREYTSCAYAMNYRRSNEYINIDLP